MTAVVEERGPQSRATSVLIPVFLPDPNPERVRLLARALESVNDQRFPDAVEILLVDDGSPTPVVSLLPALLPALGRHAQSVRVVRCARNGGVTHALNQGLKAARYPFIARLDADDAWRWGKIEKQFALFDADPDLTLTATGMVLVTPEGRELGTHVRPAAWDRLLDFVVRVGCPFPHGSVLARRDIYLALGGYPHLAAFDHCEDFALWCQWIRFFKPSMVEEVLYDYTVSSQAVSQRHGTQQARASDGLRAAFARLSLAQTLPGAIAAFAQATALSQVEAGLVAYRMWRHGLAVHLPEDAIAPLRAILPDRDVACTAPGPRALFPRAVVNGEPGPREETRPASRTVTAHPLP